MIQRSIRVFLFAMCFLSFSYENMHLNLLP
jgi:hypothetical protein